MKKTNLSRLLAGMTLLGAVPGHAQTTVTINDLRLSTAGAMVFGTPSVGTLAPVGTYPAAGNQPAGPVDLDVRIDALDLDGVGGNDDYIDFTVRFEAARDSAPVVTLDTGGSGQGVNGDLSPGNAEELTVSVVDVKPKPGLAGWANFDGFTAASLFVAGNGIGQALGVADVNGITLSPTVDTSGGYANNTQEATFALTPTVLVDNVVTSDGGVWYRSADISITYDPSAVPPPQTFTSTATNIRNTDVFPTVGGPMQGGASTGDIVLNPDLTFPPTPGPVTDYALRWTNLDLDNDGSTDDYFNFTVRVTNLVANSENVVVSNQGIGVNGNGTGDLNNGDEIQAEIVDVQVSPGIIGSVTFDGFSAAALGAGVAANGGAVSIGCDINGIPVFIDLPDNVAFQYKTDKATFPTLINTVVFDNVNETGDALNPTGRLRELDMQFTYDASIAPPPTVLTATALDLRPDATYIRPNPAGPNNGGTNLGELVTPAGFDPTMTTAAPTMDFPLRWTNLDLDNDGSADDYIDFKLRASSGTADNVSFGVEGMGVTGNMQAGEQLTFEVVDIQLSAGTPGQVTFDGFFGGSFSAIGSDPTAATGSLDVDVNGNTLNIVLPGNPGYNNVTASTAVALASTLLFDNIVQTPGSVTPAGRVRNYSLQFSYSQAGTTSDFSTWITGTFANGSVPGGQQGPDDDWDNDGTSNLLEYALAGFDPTVGNGATASISGLLVTFAKRAPLATDITYSIEESTDLGITDPWATAAPTMNTDSIITYTLTAPAPTKDFVRLKVSQNP